MDEVKVITFGCRLNIFESEIIRKNIKDAGLKNIIALHTCAVTAEAERQAKQQLHKIIKENPKAKIILTGCSAQNSWQNFKEDKSIFAILGNKEKLLPEYYKKLKNLTMKDAPHIFVGEVSKNPPQMIEVKANIIPVSFNNTNVHKLRM